MSDPTRDTSGAAPSDPTSSTDPQTALSTAAESTADATTTDGTNDGTTDDGGTADGETQPITKSDPSKGTIPNVR